eukprot:COSAG05_NODE_1152_length_5703_cov_5.326374_5_plen_181_part_00
MHSWPMIADTLSIWRRRKRRSAISSVHRTTPTTVDPSTDLDEAASDVSNSYSSLDSAALLPPLRFCRICHIDIDPVASTTSEPPGSRADAGGAAAAAGGGGGGGAGEMAACNFCSIACAKVAALNPAAVHVPYSNTTLTTQSIMRLVVTSDELMSTALVPRITDLPYYVYEYNSFTFPSR